MQWFTDGAYRWSPLPLGRSEGSYILSKLQLGQVQLTWDVAMRTKLAESPM